MESITSINFTIAEFFSDSTSAIIDIRKSPIFTHNHVKLASNFPLDSLLSRMHELPPKNSSLRLIGSCKELEFASELFLQKGYLVAAKLAWNDLLAKRLHELNLLQSGAASQVLWKPAPVIEKFLATFKSTSTNLRALDIACGAGRDAVFLALANWQVVAVDYLPGAILKVKQLASHNLVEVDALVLDLESNEASLDKVIGKFDLILIIRYLHRPLLNQIRQKLNVGGFLVYQTFSEGCEKFGKPRNPRFILKRGELAAFFSDFTIISDSIELLDDGRPTNVFIAQKTAS